jgi:hypothetical protein
LGLGQAVTCPYGDFSGLLGYCLGGDVGASPSVLEIKAACNGIDIYNFASEIEVLVELAFHCFEVDLF